MAQLLIQGGRVVDPASGFNQTADVLIADGVVAEIGRIDTADARRIDAEGCIVAPGLIDPHVHLREPDPEHRETIATGCAAAANGGFTSVCCMPNTRPPIDTEGLVQHVRHQGRDARKARVFVAACATRGREGRQQAPIAGLARAGAVSFTDDGDCVADAGVMAKVLSTVKATGSAFMQHCQDPSLTRGAVMNAGALATRLALGGWPAAAEENILERDVQLNRRIGCRYHAQHVSSGGSVEILRRARAEGRPVTAEVTPHHLLLTEELCREYDTVYKVNPPLRRSADLEQLKRGVADGTITILATDHAPHPWHKKQLPFEAAAFGMVGLDCALPLYMKALVEDGVIDVETMLGMLTINPARLLGVDRHGLGSLSVGGPADVTVIDPRLAWTIRADEFASTGRNCPYEGFEVKGRAIATIVAGQVKMNRAAARVES